MLFIGGIQLLCLAIIGSYVAHIYEESKHRPPYLVESVLNAPTKAPTEALPENGAATVEAGPLESPAQIPRSSRITERVPQP